MPSNKEDAEDRYYEEQEKFAEELEKKVPDLMDIFDDPEFFKWLEQKDKYTRKSRKDLYDEACNRFDADKVAVFFKQFKQFQEKKYKPERIGYKKGDFIGQEYEVVDILGIGGFGIVYLVYSHEVKSVFALKTFRDEYFEDISTRERFRKEAQVWIDLERHPYLVRAYFVDEISGRLFISMEYIAADESGLNTLHDYLNHRPPDLTQSLRWAIQFCHGMEYAYSKGIRAHRDIKPSNIMIGQDKAVKITDFGLAGVISISKKLSEIKTDTKNTDTRLLHQTVKGTALGTPPYMPPEQFVNAAGCDERSDIYSFGIVLYQMASGNKFPYDLNIFRNISEEEIMQAWYILHSKAPVIKLNSPLFPIIFRCLEKAPMDRYFTFKEIRRDLEKLLKKQSGELVKPPDQKELEAWEWHTKGFSLASLGKPQEAIVCYEKAIEINPVYAEAWSDKGALLFRLGKPQEAIACFDKAIEINPGDAKAWSNKGALLFRLGKPQEAIACCDRALEINPKHIGAWCNKGGALYKLGKYQEAIVCCDRALEINPKDDRAWCNKGVALASLGKPQEAIVCYEKALEINPVYAEAWSDKGALLFRLGKPQEAIVCYDKAIEINPGDAKAWSNKGIALCELGKFQEAITCYDRVIEINPREAMAEDIEYARKRLKDLTEK